MGQNGCLAKHPSLCKASFYGSFWTKYVYENDLYVVLKYSGSSYVVSGCESLVLIKYVNGKASSAKICINFERS